MTRGLPACSIVIPTRDRPRQLEACLQAIARLDYPRERLEVVVVDDGGRKPLDGVLAGFDGRLDLSLVAHAHAGPAAARNAGVEAAGGELVAFTDDDCLPEPTWLRRLAERFAVDPSRGYGGRTVNALSTNPYAATGQLIITVGYEHHNAEPDDAVFLASNNLAFARSELEAVGGFDERFLTSEDRDLCARWRLSGRSLSYVHDAVVFHASELTLALFCRQFFRYGRGAFRFRREQRRRTGVRVRIEPAYYGRVFGRPFSDPTLEPRLAASALIVVWHLANTAGFAWEWLGTRVGRPGSAQDVPTATR